MSSRVEEVPVAELPAGSALLFPSPHLFRTCTVPRFGWSLHRSSLFARSMGLGRSATWLYSALRATDEMNGTDHVSPPSSQLPEMPDAIDLFGMGPFFLFSSELGDSGHMFWATNA